MLARYKFVPLTTHTIGSRRQFIKCLTEVRNKGYSLDNEENVQGASCVATPILDGTRRAVAAISVAAL